ncbi:hypothetical protein AXF42_Ash020258 [Apostasia shenzhenica]|uniref:Uncharacterized protein n=1 Tax=Apostasia shenzhenica TaxID=1088818 RepID=A0A2I0AVU1_9ASPA|nr:hypothetical protein AXF42_Ash020258 [Apostasia shenzhenica]
MAVFVRAKRVTDPLNERVRARLRGEMTGHSTRWCEHDGATGDGPSCFSGLVHDFFVTAGGENRSDFGEYSESESSAGDPGAGDRAEEAARKLRELLDPQLPAADPFRMKLRSAVESAADILAALRPNGSGFRRAVMAKLRETGYDAAICKGRWASAGGLTSGSYEYIDVISAPAAAGEEGERRYIVDFGFAAEFEVARATEEYGRVAAALPAVVVAKPGEVREAVRIVAEAARRSLKRCGLSVPPWRKKRYMLAKWLGPYSRTVILPSASGWEVKCRALGFMPAACRGMPTATRTR